MVTKAGQSGGESTRVRGQTAEEHAARYLEGRGLRVLERNVEIGGGELDLIAGFTDDGGIDTVVFVEVRSRRDDRAGSPIETIGRRKRGRLRRAAAMWLVERGLWERVAVRFDVVGITYEGDGAGSGEATQRTTQKAPEIVWIPGAFDADEGGS